MLCQILQYILKIVPMMRDSQKRILHKKRIDDDVGAWSHHQWSGMDFFWREPKSSRRLTAQPVTPGDTSHSVMCVRSPE